MRTAFRVRGIFVFAALLALVGAALSSNPVGAQDDQNCADFTPYEAQQHLLDDPSDPDNLDGDGDGYACEAGPGTGLPNANDVVPTQVATEAPSGQTPVPTADPTDPDGDGAGDLDCADFTTQEQAQAALDAFDDDRYNLDRDGDGYACEVHFGYIGNPIPGQPDIEGIEELPNTGTGSSLGQGAGLTILILTLACLSGGVAVVGMRRFAQR